MFKNMSLPNFVYFTLFWFCRLHMNWLLLSIFKGSIRKLVEQLLSPLKAFVLPMHVDNIAHAHVATSTPTPCTNSHKFNTNVKMFFHLKPLEDNEG